MRLSSPIYHLKRRARHLANNADIPLHVALDRIAAQEGYKSWSSLINKATAPVSTEEIYSYLKSGDMVLVGARPGHGKTLLSLDIMIEAMRAGNYGRFFSLEYTEKEVAGRFQALGVNQDDFQHVFRLDCSDAICADYIIAKLDDAPTGTVVVVDYLQVLDQKREKPDLTTQIAALRSFASNRRHIILCISQIDRSFDPAMKPCPAIEDIRLPNPLDLALFDTYLFLNDGEIRVQWRDRTRTHENVTL
ncbi:DNA helicase [Ochrobactrum sp. BD67]